MILRQKPTLFYNPIVILFFITLLFISCESESFVENVAQDVVEEENVDLPEDEDSEEDGNTDDGEENTEEEETPPITMQLVNDAFNTIEEVPIVLDIFANDVDVLEEATLSFTDPTNGQLVINDNETPNLVTDDIIEYIPNPGYFGDDFLNYTVCNLAGDACFTADINITINAKPIEDDIATELKAFPKAYGAGANATGGRGGRVIHVTTLNWDGPGSLKEALTTTGPRTIVFDVSGEIDATSQSDYSIICNGSSYNDVTIAGQTAPEGGITIRTSEFIFWEVSNVIIRYIRFRNEGTTQDAIWFQGGEDIIIDHCSFSHGGDEGASMAKSNGTMGDVTIQNCIIADSKTGTILGVDRVGGDFTFINNVYANVSHRFPNPKGNGHYDIINNIVYNWKARLIRITNEGTYNIMNNYYKTSAQGLRSSGWFGETGNLTNRLHKVLYRSSNNTLIHASGSLVMPHGHTTPDADDSDQFTAFVNSDIPENDPIPSRAFTSRQFPLSGKSFEIKSAQQAYQDVLNDVGANKTLNSDGSINNYQDTKDSRDIQMIRNDSYSGSFYDARSSIPYPVIPENRRSGDYDSDADGMADAWEQAIFGDLSRDGRGDEDGDGYTDLEEFLNRVDMDNL